MLDEGKPATDFIKEEDMGGVDADTLKKLCTDAIASNPNAVADYLGGKRKGVKVFARFCNEKLTRSCQMRWKLKNC